MYRRHLTGTQILAWAILLVIAFTLLAGGLMWLWISSPS